MEADFLTKKNFTTGVNYWASHAATKMWDNWNEDVIRRDLDAMSEAGVEVLRVFPLWSDFQPITRIYRIGPAPVEYRFGEEELPDTEAGRAGMSETMMERFEKFSDIAAEKGISLIVALLTGQMTARLHMPPGLNGMNPITDPEAMVWEVRYVQYFIKRMKEHKAIVAWEFGNESNCFGKVDTPAQSSAWMALISNAIRSSDPTRPLISGMDGHAIADGTSGPVCWKAQDQAEYTDALTAHHYTMWRSSATDEFDSIKATAFPVAQNRIYSDVTGKLSFLEETGSWRPLVGNFDNHSAYLRNMCWNLWANRGHGLLWWCAFDQTDIDIAPYDWDFPGLEHGLFSADHKLLPTGAEMCKFRKFVDSLPFDNLPPAKTDAVCILGEERQEHINIGVGAYILSKQAGLEIEFQHSRAPLRDSQLYLLPSACGKAGLGSKNWKKLREKVKDGATLYMSMDYTYIDRMAEVFGVEVKARTEKPGAAEHEFSLNGEKIKLTLPNESLYRMQERGAKTIGESADGNPALFEYTYDKGKVFLMSLPLEKIMMREPQAFLSPETIDAWKIYSYIAAEQLAPKPVKKNSPFLAVSEHQFDDTKKAIVVFNYSQESTTDKLSIDGGWNTGDCYPGDASTTINGNDITITLSGNCGAVIMLNKGK